ncbi:MAG: rhodanese-like domain-containing protein [Verrucomicrobiales bacterium]
MKSPAIFAALLLSTFAPAAEKAVTHLDAPAARKLLAADQKKPAAEQVTILDLRTPEEFKEGHLKGARNIDFLGDDFEKELAKLDRKKTYLVHCQSGGRSSMALETFQKLGFQHLIHLDGGYAEWDGQ